MGGKVISSLSCFLLFIPQFSIDIKNDEPYYCLQNLEPSTRYTIKMRARVNMPDYFKGPWSEWSEEFTWETKSGTFQFGFSPRL